MKNYYLLLFALAALIGCNNDTNQKKEVHLLKVSENGRYLETDQGKPFFWLGDTGWLLFTKLTREEAATYLENRSQKGFNVIQVMVLHDLRHCINVYGDTAILAADITKPIVTEGSDPADSLAYDYWDHMDYVIDQAAERGIYMALVPIWGGNVKAYPVTPEDADLYGKFLAERYRDRKNIIWLNGGDIPGTDSTAFWKALGNSLKTNDPNHLVTYHPRGRTASSDWFHNEPWLDFNMVQSGHRRYDQDDTERNYGEDNWRFIEADYMLEPAKPTIDGEPSYEHIPQGLHDPAEPLWNDDDVRRYAYWSVFAGAFGFTYGHNEIMQFYRPGDNQGYGAFQVWQEAMEAPGASQMVHMKVLIESRPMGDRIPDQGLIANGQGEKYEYIAACRGKDYAFIYTYSGRTMDIAMGKIDGEKVKASWFDPRTGETTEAGEYENSGTMSFNPPGEHENGNDWVLILDSEK